MTKPLFPVLRKLALGSEIGRAASFVVKRPSWPESVAKPSSPPSLGADYDTAWARQPLARVVRAVAIETITRPSIKALATPTVIGADRIDRVKGPVIFAANHASHLDTSVMLTCLPSRIRHKTVVAAGADYFFDRYWKASLWALWVNAIPIEREKVGRRSADLAAGLVESGWNLVIFPEGTRTRDGFAGPFRGGAAYLSIRCDVPVIPVHIEGTGHILGAHARRLTPGRTRVTFGEPLKPLEGEKARDFNLRIERSVAVAADESRTDWWTARRNAVQGRTPSLQGPAGVSGWRKAWMGRAEAQTAEDGQWPSKR